MLGLSILSRTSFILLLPFFFIGIDKKWLKRVIYSLIALSPYLIFLLIKTFIFKESGEIKWLAGGGGEHTLYLLGIIFKTHNQQSFFLYPIILIIFSFFEFFKKDSKEDWLRVSYLYTLVMLLYYSTSFFHPQYLTWYIVPFAIILPFAKRDDLIKHFTINFGVAALLPIILMACGWLPTILLAPIAGESVLFIRENYLEKLLSVGLGAAGMSITAALFIITTYLVYKQYREKMPEVNSGN